MKSYTVIDIGFGGLCTKITILKKKHKKPSNKFFFIKIKEKKKIIRVTKKGITNYLLIKKIKNLLESRQISINEKSNQIINY